MTSCDMVLLGVGVTVKNALAWLLCHRIGNQARDKNGQMSCGATVDMRRVVLRPRADSYVRRFGYRETLGE